MQVVTQEDVQRQLCELQAGEFGPIIEKLLPGSALRIHTGEWRRRTPVPFYFLGKFNRNGKKQVSVRKVGQYYLVIKL